jgi:hypothetical protein
MDLIPDTPAANIRSVKGERHKRDRLVGLLCIANAMGPYGAALARAAPDSAFAAVFMLLAASTYFPRARARTVIANETAAMREARKRSAWPPAEDRRRKRSK